MESRYPRRGRPLLPGVLKPYFSALAIPQEVLAAHGLAPGLTFGAVDAQVWALPPEKVDAIVQALIKAVTAGRGQLASDETEVPRQAVDLDDLDLGTRARNVLLRFANVERTYRDRQRQYIFHPTPLGLVARAPGAGAKTILEVTTALEQVQGISAPREPEPPARDSRSAPETERRSRAVAREARRLSSKRWSRRLYRTDPRLGHLVRDIGVGVTAHQVAEQIGAVPHEPRDARRLASAMRRLARSADDLGRLRLEEELRQLISAVVATDAPRRALERRWGWDGAPPATLEEAARVIGVTRERVRQIEAKARRVLTERGAVWTPVLDKALRFVERAQWNTEDDLDRTLIAAGVVRGPFHLESILAAGRVLERPVPPVQLEQGLIVPLQHMDAVRRVKVLARRLTDRFGATTVDEVRAAALASGVSLETPAVRALLDRSAAVNWLDDEKHWFWIRAAGRSRVLTLIEKILSVAGSIEIGELREGVGRPQRMHGVRPPRAVLARLCADVGPYEVRGTRVFGTSKLSDWRTVLSPIERDFVEVLFENDYVMRRSDLEQVLVAQRGMNRTTFYLYLQYSAVLERFAPGVYGLRGANVGAAQVKTLVPQLLRHQVLRDFGWTTDGRIWIRYEPSPSSIAGGVLSIPSAVSALIKGAYQLFAEDHTLVGSVGVDEGRVWGVGPFFKRRGVEPGDFVVLIFSQSTREARVVVGEHGRALVDELSGPGATPAR